MFNPRVRVTVTSAATILILALVVPPAHAQVVSTGTPDGSPFAMNGAVDATAGAKIDDPDGNSQELGPANASTNKINPINSEAVLPMLGFTNPNGQVDLGGVWIATGTDTRTGRDDVWLYLAWERPDSSTGSGQIGYEFFGAAAPSECAFTNLINYVKPAGNQAPNAATQALIATCNPWLVRQDGDFFINWDQDGNTLEESDITQRIFNCTPIGPADPEDLPTCVLGPPDPFDTDDIGAALASGRKFGEMVINLTQTIFAGGGCTTLANVIPNTVTGNSDEADYKDTVLFNAEPITNCGVLKIRKRLVDSGGTVITDANDPEFEYTINRSGDDPLRFEADGYSGNDLFEIVDLIEGGETDTLVNIIAGANYQIEETDIGDNYELLSIICYDGTNMNGQVDEGNLLFDLDDTPPLDTTGPFSVVVPNGIQFTECVLTNRFLKTTPSATSTQLARVYDYLIVDAIQPGASNASSARITINLYAGDDLNCAAPLASTGELTFTLEDSGSAGLKKALVDTSQSATVAAITFGSPGGSWKWAFHYTGDAFNNPITLEQSCGWESGFVSFSETAFPAPATP